MKEEKERIEEVIEERIIRYAHELLEEKGLNLREIEKIRHSSTSEA